MTTAVLKVALHCQGCIEKIQRVTSKFKGERRSLFNNYLTLLKGIKELIWFGLIYNNCRRSRDVSGQAEGFSDSEGHNGH